MTAATFVGGRWPEGDASPALLFHKGHLYDRFEPEVHVDRGRNQIRQAFKTENTRLAFLKAIAERIQQVNRNRYPPWHRRFDEACRSLEAEPPVTVETWWRLVAGWATNPALEVGLTLDPLLGFPHVPGSSVKGLLHRVAEMELLDEPEPAPSPPADGLPETPPADLVAALARALRIRALFGSLAARRERGSDQPEAPVERLQGWLGLLEPRPQGEPPPAWREVYADLTLLCGDQDTGGLVSCFDLVPVQDAFSASRPLVEPDVLTPHTTGQPVPIQFLAVRAGARFEVRFSLGDLPSGEGEPRDDEEAFRRRALAGSDRQTLLVDLHRWLLRGLAEHGLGGKTSAGYGYLLPPGTRPDPPPSPKEVEEALEQEDLPADERYAREVLPENLTTSLLHDALDKAIAECADPEHLAAVGRRLAERFPAEVERMRGRRLHNASQRRLRALGLDRPAAGEGESE